MKYAKTFQVLFTAAMTASIWASLPSIGRAESSESSDLGLSASLGPLFVVPTPDVQVTGGGSLGLIYFLPLLKDPAASRTLGLTGEAGWYPLFGHGTGAFSEFDYTGTELGHVTTDYEFDWTVQIFPIYLGVIGRLSAAQLGIGGSLEPEIFVRAGGLLAFATATATVSRPDSPPFVTDNKVSDEALGFFIAAGGGIALGPGSLILEYRYANARLDFGFDEYNVELGDVGGNLVRLAYRFDF